ncbi:MAG: hypothetical protein AUJ52_08750 [Elusimicrobia bacterium CG1_02_63_36]|nr:MAG: hypothetical protein AUJ52_08750 [Elusimicrobia bacterium CG1_02_63_36]PIP82584.1 MAG: biopolymer transporter ExbD [Elusimicrobia bacterium CG22_combo_CG10-13_8_21_14_all_63_91]PJA17222.1 MAG: biopolymer transporter ExbD [Elusimicrobia bacterium CG_4_10_14_0_2_um_filter_63_34]PJB25032.1 MAG: biopolymer transporter ExbD [Elusimicrobia bacterium CG_4_9_14_3_um_filter_62_55]
MKSLSEASGPITDINVTPLVDIILVVLIIFMATAPLMHRRQLPVDVPKAAHNSRVREAALEVAFDRAGTLRFNGSIVGRKDLARALAERLSASPDSQVILSADRSLTYGEIVGVLDLIRGAGLKRISLEVRGG